MRIVLAVNIGSTREDGSGSKVRLFMARPVRWKHKSIGEKCPAGGALFIVHHDHF
jgi:hypothetical protein